MRDNALRFPDGRKIAESHRNRQAGSLLIPASPTQQHAANAPVSYPCLWDAPLHRHVQWNGAAENRTSPLGRILFNTMEVGALGRNAGEVLGVFGHVNVNGIELPVPLRYSSTVNTDNLISIENSLKNLWSPKWPEEAFGALDTAMVARGKEIYKRARCLECHNGSVPNLVELLKPAEKRVKKFRIGSQEFDPINIGFKEDRTKPVFDTTARGISNSNSGHEFGTELSDSERRDLLEYLKSL